MQYIAFCISLSLSFSIQCFMDMQRRRGVFLFKVEDSLCACKVIHCFIHCIIHCFMSMQRSQLSVFSILGNESPMCGSILFSRSSSTTCGQGHLHLM